MANPRASARSRGCARGGFTSGPGRDGADDALFDSLRLRDDEQLMVKLSYRFEL